MTIAFACAMGHAPGILAWTDAAPVAQKDRLYAAFDELRARLEAARLDALIVFTAEHWANFFLDHMSAFCVGVAGHFDGPIEPWLKIPKVAIPGDEQLARAILTACYDNELEPSFAQEMHFDHGTMTPLHFLTPEMKLPVVPIVINTLAPPFPSARRCLKLGQVVGNLLRDSNRRVGMVATGGMSHDPGERNHGTIDSDFDCQFLEHMRAGDLEALGRYSSASLAAAGTGAVELLNWIALAGALQSFRGHLLSYEPVKPWATGIGAMAFELSL